jgi:hypothetical protein
MSETKAVGRQGAEGVRSRREEAEPAPASLRWWAAKAAEEEPPEEPDAAPDGPPLGAGVGGGAVGGPPGPSADPDEAGPEPPPAAGPVDATAARGSALKNGEASAGAPGGGTMPPTEGFRGPRFGSFPASVGAGA